jgi:hypothetical protein
MDWQGFHGLQHGGSCRSAIGCNASECGHGRVLRLTLSTCTRFANTTGRAPPSGQWSSYLAMAIKESDEVWNESDDVQDAPQMAVVYADCWRQVHAKEVKNCRRS